MIDKRDTFNFTPYKGYYVTLRHGAFAGYVCLINTQAVGGGKHTGKRLAKFQGARSDVLSRAMEWIDEKGERQT